MRIPKELIDEILNRINLADYVAHRGVQTVNQGSSVKAKCPFHEDGTPSFSIPAGQQFFKCFGCEVAGDLYTFIMKYDNVDFPEAVRIAASYADIPIPEGDFMDPEEIERRKDRELLNVIYTVAADYCHSVMPKDIRDHLRNNYGFEDWFIDEKKIGFDDGHLYNNLIKMGFEKADLLKSGLFVLHKNGRVSDFFTTRIVFWYWKNGFPVYAIGRETEYTQALNSEFEEGRKYKKLLTYNEEHRTYVSKEVENKYIYNEDAFLSAAGRPEYGIITEGITDAMLAEQKGIPVMSPVTKQFRKADIDKLKRICRHIPNIYIVNDNEENQSGLKGGLATAKELSADGKNSYITTLPRPEGVEKVDLNVFLKGIKDEEEFRAFLNQSSTLYLDFIIEKADEAKEQGDEMRFQSLVDEALYEARNMKPMAQESFFKSLSKKLNMRIGTIRDQFKAVLGEEKSKPEHKESEDYYQDLIDKALEEREESVGHKLYKVLIDRGAKFFRPGGMENTEVTMILGGDMYRIVSEESPFTMFLQTTFGMNYLDHAVKKAIFEFKAIAHMNAMRIKKQTWLYCDKASKTVYLGVGYEDNRIIKITPSKIDIVANGEDDGVFVNLPDDVMTPWTFDPKVDKGRVARELLHMVKTYSPCSDDEAVLVLLAALSFPLKRFVDTTPIIKVHGQSSAGKTQIAKMVLNIFFGNERALGDMTDASKYDQSDKRMVIVFDNIEDTKGGATEQFLLYSASGGGREKRDRNTESGTMKQIVDCLPILTAIHPFGRQELINRSLDITADKRYHNKSGEMRDITVVNDELRERRDEYLSLWILLLQDSLKDIESIKSKRHAIHARFEQHFKERLNAYFALMWHVLEVYYGYIGMTKQEAQDMVFRWIEQQSRAGSQNEKDTSTIFYLLSTMVKLLRMPGNEYIWIKDMCESADHNETQETITFELSGQQLFTIFQRIARELGQRLEYQTTQQLMTRVHNDRDILSENGWNVELSFRTKRRINLHRFTYSYSDEKPDFMNALRPDGDDEGDATKITGVSSNPWI